MAIKEHSRSNSTDNRIPFEICNMVSSPLDWYELQSYSRAEIAVLRKKFNSTERGKFAEGLADNPDKVKNLKKAGFTDEDIKRLKNKKLPDGYQVHHKMPIDDSGTNDPSNLVLIKNDPYHKTITNYQNSFAKNMKDGDVVDIDFPILKGSIYPPIKE